MLRVPRCLALSLSSVQLKARFCPQRTHRSASDLTFVCVYIDTLYIIYQLKFTSPAPSQSPPGSNKSSGRCGLLWNERYSRWQLPSSLIQCKVRSCPQRTHRSVFVLLLLRFHLLQDTNPSVLLQLFRTSSSPSPPRTKG